MFKKLNKVYNELFTEGWYGDEVSEIKRIKESLENREKDIKKLLKKIELIKEYLDVQEETITREDIKEGGCFNFFTGEQASGGTITKLVKKIKSKKNK